MAFYSTKTVGTDRGLSCVFRQWKATHSHCSLMHGYSLGFRFVFACNELDKNNWVVDFGQSGFGPIKKYLEYMFDHTILVAEDDPQIELLKSLDDARIADLRIVPAIGCEKTAEFVFKKAQSLIHESTQGRCWVESVECFEHAANSAIYKRD